MNLDTENEFSSIDQEDIRETLENIPDHINQAQTHVAESDIPRLYDVDHILINGMDEGHLAGELLCWYLREKMQIPIMVNSGETLPKWVDKHTLVLSLNYSGECLRTLSIFKEAYQKHCKLIGICSDGRLKKYCMHRHLPIVDLPHGYHSRFTILLLFFSSLFSLLRTGLLQSDLKQDIKECEGVLSNLSKSLNPKVDTKKNDAKKIAIKLKDSIPLVYGWNLFSPVAKHWVKQFNQNSKLISYVQLVPDSTDHGIVGLANQKVAKNFLSILFRDHHLETKEMKCHLNFLKSLTSEVTNQSIIIAPEGKSKLAKMISLLYLGDMISVYTAIYNDVNPAPTPILNQLHQKPL
ncbi:MAG: hypothetical protein KGY50_01235 [Candidatus Thermoplasmatota archaeon]|nr:hypothetical protein [Candidatus Thermoplasmatota archaeon]